MAAHLRRPLRVRGFSMLALLALVQPSSGQSNQQNLARSAKIEAASRIGDEQADASRMIDGDPETRWSTGPGDLALDPAQPVDHILAARLIDGHGVLPW